MVRMFPFHDIMPWHKCSRKLPRIAIEHWSSGLEFCYVREFGRAIYSNKLVKWLLIIWLVGRDARSRIKSRASDSCSTGGVHYVRDQLFGFGYRTWECGYIGPWVDHRADLRMYQLFVWPSRKLKRAVLYRCTFFSCSKASVHPMPLFASLTIRCQ